MLSKANHASELSEESLIDLIVELKQLRPVMINDVFSRSFVQSRGISLTFESSLSLLKCMFMGHIRSLLGHWVTMFFKSASR